MAILSKFYNWVLAGLVILSLTLAVFWQVSKNETKDLTAQIVQLKADAIKVKQDNVAALEKLKGEHNQAIADAEKAMQGYTPYTLAEVSVPAFVNLKDHNWMWGIQIEAANITGNGGLPTWPSKLSSFTGSGYSTGAGCYKYINKLVYHEIKR